MRLGPRTEHPTSHQRRGFHVEASFRSRGMGTNRNHVMGGPLPPRGQPPPCLRKVRRGYFAGMAKWLLLRSMPRLRLLLHLLMVALATGSVLGRDVAFGSHCAKHGADESSRQGMAMSVGSSMVPDTASTAQTQYHPSAHESGSWAAFAPSGHQCPHCPPAECGTALPCASGSSSQSAPSTITAVASLPTQSLRPLIAAQRATSILQEPPTPPPQAAA
jgi:hypothetical protein